MPVHVALLGSAICNKISNLAQAQAQRTKAEANAGDSSTIPIPPEAYLLLPISTRGVPPHPIFACRRG